MSQIATLHAAVPGVDEFAYTLNSAQDATLLAEYLDRLADGTVVVAGGGLTGIESAAEIAERHPELDVVLLSRQVPGSMMGPNARARLHAGLQRDGELQPVDHIPSAQSAARAGSGDLAARRPVNAMNADQQTFADHRNLLFSIGYRILGSAADAEDVVQDAWFKWSADDRSQVSDPKAYLARIVSNLSMERIRSTRRQRETYVGPWLPEPILTRTDAADDVAAESVSMAMLVVLETLSPPERAVFVLKEVFDFSYAEIGDAVERSESAVRQAAHRAGEHVRARRPQFDADCETKREATVDRGHDQASYEGVEIADMTAELVEINGGPGI